MQFISSPCFLKQKKYGMYFAILHPYSSLYQTTICSPGCPEYFVKGPRTLQLKLQKKLLFHVVKIVVLIFEIQTQFNAEGGCHIAAILSQWI